MLRKDNKSPSSVIPSGRRGDRNLLVLLFAMQKQVPRSAHFDYAQGAEQSRGVRDGKQSRTVGITSSEVFQQPAKRNSCFGAGVRCLASGGDRGAGTVITRRWGTIGGLAWRARSDSF